ncbi:ArsR/SmtB family transcription factor [Microbacterium murale]|uniref:DNA-binding transcriptional ArsR family regulator n=1 Tax=Microbacterium murale TaxID=1081040 RepID=A0ABU0P585_9MICO|nr:helix-turn-helix domain-containing protein [Microbacterium murale]MDQ0641876.1 DNA-binding transcriptional ArsR family regulator [Microbacterium murale]
MTDNEKAPIASERRVLDAGALRALSHPLRVRIFDILAQEGPQTASTLAEILGESSGATSYHLRALARHDLIREVAGEHGGRERWWERPAGGIVYDSRAVQGSPSGEAALQVAVAEAMRRRHDELMEFFSARIDKEPAEWADASSSMTSGISMTAEQTIDLIKRIEAVIDEAAVRYRGQKGEGVRRVSVRADVFPLKNLSNKKETAS